MLRVVQLTHSTDGRRIAIVEEPHLRLVADYNTVYDAALGAIAANAKLAPLLLSKATTDTLDYDAIYQGRSLWKLLPCFDHPVEPSRCYVTGTGLTHKASATMRQSMHGKPQVPTDSMKMYVIGLQHGRPEPNCIGAAPEWFYKGTGQTLRAHNQVLQVPDLQTVYIGSLKGKRIPYFRAPVPGLPMAHWNDRPS